MSEFRIADTAAMHALGRRIGAALHAGQVVILSGPLGAGKTTLTQGIGAGLGVAGAITSPTFVIARTHRSQGNGPKLIHVDAYRLNSLAEVDDLDLDAELSESVLIAEWGAGKIDALLDIDVVIRIDRDDDSETRTVRIEGLEL